jgi:hypothetical protein
MRSLVIVLFIGYRGEMGGAYGTHGRQVHTELQDLGVHGRDRLNLPRQK